MTQRERKLLCVSGTALALLVMTNGLILPCFQEKQSLETELQTLTETQLRQAERIQALQYLDDAISEHSAALSTASAPYPSLLSPEEMDSILTTLLLKWNLIPQTLTLQTGESCTVSAYQDADRTVECWVGRATVTAQGRTKNWLKLLDELQTSYPYLRLVSFTINGSMIQAEIAYYMQEASWEIH